MCVGFCAAGSVTTLAAAWVAVQWPTADVRCISFGAPAVGNAEFTASFKYASLHKSHHPEIPPGYVTNLRMQTP